MTMNSVIGRVEVEASSGIELLEILACIAGKYFPL